MDDTKIEAVKDIANANKQEIAQVKVRVDIFDTNIDKLTDISLNVSKLLAVHEQRLDAAEKANRLLPELMEQHRVEAQSHAARAIDRANKIDSDLRQELGKSQKEILDEIRVISNGMIQLRSDVNITTQTVKDDFEVKLKAREATLNTKLDAVDERIDGIQKFIWLATGGAAVVGAVLSQLSGLLHISIGG